MTCHGFNFALERTEVVILTKKGIATLHLVSIGELIMGSKLMVKYIGSILDLKISLLD